MKQDTLHYPLELILVIFLIVLFNLAFAWLRANETPERRAPDPAVKATDSLRWEGAPQ